MAHHRLRERNAVSTNPEVVSRGIISNGSLIANYYTSEPSPEKWIAVATVMWWPIRHDVGFPKWLLVGVGRTETLAVADLRARMKEASTPRWKIKCEPAQPSARDVVVEDAIDHNGTYVVPWEIDHHDVAEPVDLTALEATPS